MRGSWLVADWPIPQERELTGFNIGGAPAEQQALWRKPGGPDLGNLASTMTTCSVLESGLPWFPCELIL